MQAGNEAAAIDLFAAAGAVAETDDVRAALGESCGEGKPLGVEGEGDKAFLTICQSARKTSQ